MDMRSPLALPLSMILGMPDDELPGYEWKMSGKKKAKKKPTGKRARRARSSITGRFVSLAYAKRHPRTTVTEKC